MKINITSHSRNVSELCSQAFSCRLCNSLGVKIFLSESCEATIAGICFDNEHFVFQISINAMITSHRSDI